MRTKLMLTVMLLLLLAGCGTSSETASDPAGTPADIAAEIISGQTDIPSMELLFPEEEAFAAYLSQTCGISGDAFEDGVICYAGGVEASEIAVLVFSDEAAARDAENALLEYIEIRADSFAGYVPEQAALVENSTAVSQGRYAALLICADPGAAKASFLACFEAGWEPAASLNLREPMETLQVLEPTPLEVLSEKPTEDIPITEELVLEGTASKLEDTEPVPVPVEFISAEEEPPSVFPEALGEDTAEIFSPDEPIPAPIEPAQPVEDHYDHNAVVSAWQGGSPDTLSEKNRAVYDAASAVISQLIASGMTPYQQELAIHDYPRLFLHSLILPRFL